jgi:RNA polymerase sigma-70 factor (ECF subfamily)
MTSTPVHAAARDAPADSALVAAWRAGDENAARALVIRHAPPLARFLYAMGARREDVEDLVQEALFRGFRKLDGWRGGSLQGWLFTIGRNLLISEMRRVRGRTLVPIDDRDLPDPVDPHAEMTAAELDERLRVGIASLPRLQREVFLRRARGGASYEAIAAELDTTPGAARVHYHHAVKRLKELIP